MGLKYYTVIMYYKNKPTRLLYDCRYGTFHGRDILFSESTACGMSSHLYGKLIKSESFY